MMTPAKFGECWQQYLMALCLLLASVTYAMPSYAGLTSSVDRANITVDDTFTLVIRSTEASIFDSPELGPLEQDFNVHGNSRSSQTSIINGRTESSMEWHISLSPKREGALVIPPIDVDGKKTKAIVVEVTKSAPLPKTDGVDPVFMKAELEHDTLYVQAQTLLTVRIYYAVALARGAQLSELEIPNAVVTQINEASFETRIKGLRYNVHEVKYAIFPQRSGKIEIPAQVFSANIASQRRSNSLFDNLGGPRGRAIKVQSTPLTLDVQAQADAFSGKQWLPAKKLVLEESWTKDPNNLKAGEPTTRTLTIVAEGLQGSQLPPLDVAKLQNAQQYPDQAETSDEVSGLGINGTRIESQAVIPSAGGTLRVPAVTVTWWNTLTDKQEQATIPAKSYSIAGPPAAIPSVIANPALPASQYTRPDEANASAAETNVDSSGGFWKVTTLLCLALWLATLAYFLFFKRTAMSANADSHKNENVVDKECRLFEQLEQYKAAGNNKDLTALKTGLIQWGRAYVNKPNLSSLAGLAGELGDGTINEQLTRLDAAIYQRGSDTPQSSLDIDQLIDSIEQLRHNRQQKKPHKPASLEPLYRTA